MFMAEQLVIRRLWRAREDPAAGDVAELSLNERYLLVRRGKAFPVLPAAVDEPQGVVPLATLIRHWLAWDPELRGLSIAADCDGVGGNFRSDYIEGEWTAWRHRPFSTRLPRFIRPAEFSEVSFRAEFGVPPPGGWYAAADTPNRRPDYHFLLRRRMHELLGARFDDLRHRRRVVTGIPAGGNGAPVAIPSPATWDSPSLLFDVVDNALVAGEGKEKHPVFLAAAVSQPKRPLPDATAKRFLEVFARELFSFRFTIEEALQAIQRAFPAHSVSEKQITKLLREQRPSNWGPGRPSPEERPPPDRLDAAARIARAAADQILP